MLKIRLTAADYILVGLLLIIGLSGFWFNLQKASAVEHKYAVIYHQNKVVAELSLTEEQSFTYSFNFGPENQYEATVEIEDGKIRMMPISEELCPAAICSHTGWINYSYESIVCLPNQILIVFTEGPSIGDEYDLDGVTF